MLKIIKEHIKQGNKAEARKLLKQYLQSNPEDSEAWLLAARVANTKQQAISCLQKVVNIDPFNEVAAKQLEKLTGLQDVVSPDPKNKRNAKSSINTTYIAIAGVVAIVFVGFLILLATVLPKSNTLDVDLQSPTRESQVVATMPPPTSTMTPTPASTLPPTWTLTPTERATSVSLPTQGPQGTRDDPYPFDDGYVRSIRDGDGMIGVSDIKYDAWSIVESLNMFNPEPSRNQQWVLVGIGYKCDLPSNEACNISPLLNFELLGSNGKLYEPPLVLTLNEYELQSTILGGDTASGYIGFLVDRSDSNFLFIAKGNIFSDERTFYKTQ